jgi:hypothetical protein
MEALDAFLREIDAFRPHAFCKRFLLTMNSRECPRRIKQRPAAAGGGPPAAL